MQPDASVSPTCCMHATHAWNCLSSELPTCQPACTPRESHQLLGARCEPCTSIMHSISHLCSVNALSLLRTTPPARHHLSASSDLPNTASASFVSRSCSFCSYRVSSCAGTTSVSSIDGDLGKRCTFRRGHNAPGLSCVCAHTRRPTLHGRAAQWGTGCKGTATPSPSPATQTCWEPRTGECQRCQGERLSENQ